MKNNYFFLLFFWWVVVVITGHMNKPLSYTSVHPSSPTCYPLFLTRIEKGLEQRQITADNLLGWTRHYRV